MDNIRNTKAKLELLISDIISNNEKYSNDDIEKIIREYCYILAKQYCTSIKVIVVDSKQLDVISSIKGINALIKNDSIYIKRELILDIRKGNLDILRTIYHEVHHINQNQRLINFDFSYNAILYLMDYIICCYMDIEYYDINYECNFEEIEARVVAYDSLLAFLNLYFPADYNKLKEEIYEDLLYLDEQKNNIYRKVGSKFIEREELLDIIIQNNPTLLSVYEILQFYYNFDGSKKSIVEIIERQKNKNISSDIEEIYHSLQKMDYLVIKNRRGTRKNIMKDIESLKPYIQNNQFYYEIYLTLQKRLEECSKDNISDYLKNCSEYSGSYKKKIIANK